MFACHDKWLHSSAGLRRDSGLKTCSSHIEGGGRSLVTAATAHAQHAMPYTAMTGCTQHWIQFHDMIGYCAVTLSVLTAMLLLCSLECD